MGSRCTIPYTIAANVFNKSQCPLVINFRFAESRLAISNENFAKFNSPLKHFRLHGETFFNVARKGMSDFFLIL